MKIIYEDQNLMVIDKPAGMVVHPGAGVHEQTLVDWLIKKYPKIQKLKWPDPARPGIVHRLDKDTSGLMILAKNPATLQNFQKMMQTRKIKKSYLALVLGKLNKPSGEITGFIGRDPHARRQQTLSSIHFDWQPGKARESKTLYKVLKEYTYCSDILTLVEATLDTGRMHQIRVHFKSIGHPIIGDQVYNTKHSRKVSKEFSIIRQFLHAYKLEFNNPIDEKTIRLESPLPDDLKSSLKELT